MRLHGVAIVLAVLVMTAGGCGSGGDEGDDVAATPLPSPTAAPSTAPTPTTTPTSAPTSDPTSPLPVSPSPSSSTGGSHATSGEVLVLYSAMRQDTAEAGDTRLLRVDAGGEVETVATWPDGAGPYEIADVSPDGRRALVLGADPGTHEHQVWIVDLATGQQRLVASAPELEFLHAAFTRPTGRNVVVRRDDDERVRLQRVDDQGQVLATLADVVKPREWPWTLDWLYGPDGTTLVLGGDGQGLRIVSNDGATRQGLDTPTTCVPVRWWDAATVLASCRTGAPDLYFSQLWLVPADGGAASALTGEAPPETPNVDFGHQDAVRVGDVTILQWAGDCGAAQVRRLEADGTTTALDVPAAEGALLASATDARLLVHATAGCDGGGELVSSALDGSDVRVLVPRGDGEFGVVSAVGLGF